MIKYGGATTVVAVGPRGVMLSWAGGPTAIGTADVEQGLNLTVS
jgi:hypothetical protein